MRRKEALLKLAIIVMVILGLAGCSGKRDVVSQEAETLAESTQETSEEKNVETDIPEQEECSNALWKRWGSIAADSLWEAGRANYICI